jgi:GntR family transcriptional regulator/MocR family aminotransferase
VAAGLHAHVTLADRPAVTLLLEQAWAAGVALLAYEDERGVHLLLGFASLPEPSVAPGVRALAEAVRAATR